MRTSKSWALALGFGVVLAGLLAFAPDARAEGNSTFIIMQDKIYICKIIKHDEKSISVVLLETNPPTPLTMQWTDLPPVERSRLKGLVTVNDPALAGRPLGVKIPGVEVVLRSGISYFGIELPDRSTPELRAFRFRGMPFVAISNKDIKDVKKTEIYDSEVYTPSERYEKKKATTPPRTPEEEFQMGVWCMDNELVQQAGDHFAKAELLDPAYGEKRKEKQPALDALAKKMQAEALDKQVMEEIGRGAYTEVLKDIKKLAELYPDFKKNTEYEMMKPTYQARRDKQLRREVVSLWNLYTDRCIDKIVYTQLSETPGVPMKVIWVKNRTEPLMGVIKGSEDAAELQLDIGDGQMLSIKRELVTKMEQRMVEKGPFRERTLAECRTYVTDAKGGITADVITEINKALGIEPKEITDIWSKRISEVYVVTDTGIKEPEQAATYQDARWSFGSWLRGAGSGNNGGVGGVGGVGGNPGGSNPRGGNNPRAGVGTGGGAAAGGNQQQAQWKDPETWWKEQPRNIRVQILKAMCAEQNANFKVEKTYEENCINCGGTGKVEVMNIGVGANGGRYSYDCSICRGSGRFYGVIYR